MNAIETGYPQLKIKKVKGQKAQLMLLHVCVSHVSDSSQVNWFSYIAGLPYDVWFAPTYLVSLISLTCADEKWEAKLYPY